MCSIHLMMHQNTHHTPATGGEETVMKSISVWGWLGGHDGQRTVGEFGQDTGVTSLLFFEGHPGIFNDHRESGPRFNVSSERRCSDSIVSRHYTGVLGPTQTTGWAPPAGITNTSSSRNLVFSGVSHPGTDQLNPAYLQWEPVLGCRVIWLLAYL